MMDETPDKRAQRLARARSFLDAGKTQIAPQPQPPSDKAAQAKTQDGADGEAPKADPTRFGDWEKNGRCIDF